MKKIRMLIVDDEALIIEAIIRLIDSYDLTLSIESTTHAELASEWLKTEPFDILLTDQRMPLLSGLSLIAVARQYQPGIQCLLMSAYSDFDMIVTAINDGQISGFIMKPWKSDDVESSLRRALQVLQDREDVEKIRNLQLAKNEDWILAVDQMKLDGIEQFRRQVKALSTLVHAKDPDLYDHSIRVSSYAIRIARILMLPADRMLRLELAAQIHDLGKIAIKDAIHYKPGSLDDSEFVEMKRHPQIGAEILRDLDVDEAIVLIIEQHHERIDGLGYPKGLKDQSILLEAKILSVADAYDALTTDRTYRKGMSTAEAIQILQNSIHKIYDADVVDALIKSF